MLWPNISHIFGTGRPTNFKLGAQMEYDGRPTSSTCTKVSNVKITRPFNALTEYHPWYLQNGKAYKLQTWCTNGPQWPVSLTCAVTSKLKALGGSSSHHLQGGWAYCGDSLQAAQLVKSSKLVYRSTVFQTITNCRQDLHYWNTQYDIQLNIICKTILIREIILKNRSNPLTKTQGLLHTEQSAEYTVVNVK